MKDTKAVTEVTKTLAKTTFKEKTYSYSLQGKGGLKLGGLPKTTVKYDQVVHLAGMRFYIS